MAEIRAFVAHSFLDKDQPLIGKFLGFFDSVKKVLPNFSWDHAKDAKPIPVSQKVLELMEGKNLLISICTPNELAISANTVGNLRFFTVAPTNSFERKASDWIIQEIGVAIGRDMKIIVLLQKGVRIPGRLFSDLEYIEFSPENLEECFNKLLQMLGAMIPNDGVSAAVVEPKLLASEKPSAEPGDDENWQPKPSWDQEQYEQAAFRAIVFKRGDFKTIGEAFRNSPFARDGSVLWSARIESFRIIADEKFDFDIIKKAAFDNPKNAEPRHFLAMGYREFREYESAALAEEEAAANEGDDPLRLRYLMMAALNYAEVEKWERVSHILERLRREIANKTDDIKFEFLDGLIELSKRAKDRLLEISILEEIIELRPSDTSRRFNLAYAHSEEGNADLALYHYLKIPEPERGSSAWNNLGVVFNSFQMSARAIYAYRASEEKGEALAMCNMGQKLLNAGFLDEAREMADKARAANAEEKELPELLKRLEETPKEEDEKLRKTLDEVRPKADFFRKLGAGVLRPTPTAFPPSWSAPDAKLEATFDGSVIQFSGTYQQQTSGLAAALNPFSATTHTYKVQFQGKVQGGAIFGKLKRQSNGSPPMGLLASGSADGEKTVMLIDEDCSELSVMERADSRRPTFYKLTRLEGG
jgi:tetratricopeptide (TPR) repeat protein